MPKTIATLSYPGQQRRFLLIGGIYIALWIATWYSAKLLESVGFVSLWFLPAGFRFFCLLVFGWPGLLLELAVQFIFALMQITAVAGPPITEFLSVNSLWRLFNLLGSLAANAIVVLPLRRWMSGTWDFTRPAHSALFLAAALVASMLSAFAGTYGIVQLGFIKATQFPDVFPSWLIGDFIGIITLAPLLLVRLWPGLYSYLRNGRWRSQNQSVANKRNADVRTLLIVLSALLVVFGIPWYLNLNPHFPLLALLLLLPLAGVAWHQGLRGAVLGVMLLDSGLVVLISFFGEHAQALQYQIVMISIALVGLWLGGAVEAINRLMVRYRDFASISNDLLWETDRRGNLTEATGRLADHLAWSPGQSWRHLLGYAPQPQLAVLERALAHEQPFRNLEIALHDHENTLRWIRLNGLPLRNAAGDLTGYRGTAVDVSSARNAEELLQNYNETLLREVAERTQELNQSHSELASKERHLQVLLAAAPVGVLEIDEAQNCCFINVNGCMLTGCTPDQAQGRHFLDFVHAEDRDYVGYVWKSNSQSDEVQWLEFRLERTKLRCTAHWIRMANADQSANGAIMILTNATARSQHDDRLWTLAHHDALTDLPNRNLFWDRIGQALREAKRRNGGAAVLWLDLDGFKAVNDQFGHAAGDALLQQVAQRLKSRIRDSDTVARLGGDEFAVIMPDISTPEGAVRIAEGLVASLAEAFHLPQGTTHVSASIGVALYPTHAETVENLVQCADAAMYSAKRAGKNQVQVCVPDTVC